MAKLGGGILKAGRYEVSAAVTVETGAVMLGVLDVRSEEWLATLIFDTDRNEALTAFELRAPLPVAVYLCANNSEGPQPVTAELNALCVITPDEGGMVRASTSAQAGRPVTGLLRPEIGRLLGRKGILDEVHTGLSFTSEALQFERMARLGGGTLKAGRYQVSAAVTVETGAVMLGVLDVRSERWLATLIFDTDRSEAMAAFELRTPLPVVLYLCANNSEGPQPVTAELRSFALTVNGQSGADEKVDLSAARVVADALTLLPSSSWRGDDVTLRNAFAIEARSARREYIAKGEPVVLEAGHYRLRAAASIDVGALSVGLLDNATQTWIASLPLRPDDSVGEVEFDIPARTFICAVVSADNMELGRIRASFDRVEIDRLDTPIERDPDT
jgi:hypothetical protein